MGSCYKKIVAYQSEIRFDPNIPDLAIPHAFVSVSKLFKLLYTIHYDYFVVYPGQNKILLATKLLHCKLSNFGRKFVL
jgi:hypothetical protein